MSWECGGLLPLFERLRCLSELQFTVIGRKAVASRRTPHYERISPGNLRGLLSKPGNTGLRSATPMCFVKTSPTTERKSVVIERSHPSFN